MDLELPSCPNHKNQKRFFFFLSCATLFRLVSSHVVQLPHYYREVSGVSGHSLGRLVLEWVPMDHLLATHPSDTTPPTSTRSTAGCSTRGCRTEAWGGYHQSSPWMKHHFERPHVKVSVSLIRSVITSAGEVLETGKTEILTAI